MEEKTIKKQKISAKINDQFDVTIFLVEVKHDGETFSFGTGLVTSDFHIWFRNQIQYAQMNNEDFNGCVYIELEDKRVGRALISHLETCEEAGSKISFVFHGNLVSTCEKEQSHGDS